MAKRLIGVGLIGYGKFGQHLARAVGTTHLGRIVKIWSRSREKIDLANSRGFAATQDVDEVINDPQVEAVIVASANYLHKEHVLKVCQAKKMLWAEKPLVLNLPDYDEIVAAVKKAGVINHCNFSLRFNPNIAKMITVADSGVLGTPFQVKVHQFRGAGTWSAGSRHHAVADPQVSGGWNIHHNCHSVDLLIRLVRNPVSEVYARFSRSTAEAPSEESILSTLTFKNGCIGEATDCLCSRDEMHTEVIASQGSAFYTSKDNTLTLYPGAQPEKGEVYQFGGFPDDDMRAFLTACQGDQAPIVPIAEGRHVLEVLLAMGQSAREGRIVRL